jgi:hypothetical protein
MGDSFVANSSDFVDDLINCCMALAGTVVAGGLFGAALTFLAISASPQSIIPGFTLGLIYSAIPGVVVSPVVFLLSGLARFRSDEKRTRFAAALTGGLTGAGSVFVLLIESPLRVAVALLAALLAAVTSVIAVGQRTDRPAATNIRYSQKSATVLLLFGFFLSNSLVELLRIARSAAVEDPGFVSDLMVLQILRVFVDGMLVALLSLPLVYVVFRIFRVDSLQNPGRIRRLLAIGLCAAICCLISGLFNTPVNTPGVVSSLMNVTLTTLFAVLLSKRVCVV